VIGAFLVARLFLVLRKLRPTHQETWDEKMVERLRSRGFAPFNEYPVAFFLALPDEAACSAVRGRLERDGFSVDVKQMKAELFGQSESQDSLPLGLHATRQMRLLVADVSELSKRMTELAAEYHGRYDGWTV
jgi:hypothetical protein